jgi:dihydrolipoamide dehydrogenase
MNTNSLRKLGKLPKHRYYAAAVDQDVVVIGGGPGGYVAAIKAAQLGLKVTCVEKRGALGGTCLNVGCIPSKALLHTSYMFTEAKHSFAKHGILVDNPRMDITKMLAQKDSSVSKLTGGIEYLFKKNGVTYEKGAGKITKANTVEVKRSDGTTEVINTKNIIIATGSEPTTLPTLPPIDEISCISSTGALSLKKVPNHMILIGGGVIGLEMGSVWSRLGAKVTVIEFQNFIAAGADKEVATHFQKLLKGQGMEFVMETAVTGAVKEGDNYKVSMKSNKSGETKTLECDVLLVCVGRKPYTEGLGLENVGIVPDKRGIIPTDSHRRTTAQNIWAIGDVISGPMLAHKAEEEGIAVVEDIVSPGVGHVNYDAIPSVIYTHPEVSWVGKTEEQLKTENVKYKVGKFPFAANSRAKTNDDADGFIKFLSDSETDKILGCHMIGPNVGELISEVVLAMEYGASSEDIARTCHAHPTLSEAVKEAAMATYSKPIHF